MEIRYFDIPYGRLSSGGEFPGPTCKSFYVAVNNVFGGANVPVAVWDADVSASDYNVDESGAHMHLYQAQEAAVMMARAGHVPDSIVEVTPGGRIIHPIDFSQTEFDPHENAPDHPEAGCW